jgi:hypothetical protein
MEIINRFTINNVPINWNEYYRIPINFIGKKKLIISVIIPGDTRKVDMGFVIPYTNFGVTLEGELEYFWEKIFIGNRLIEVNPIANSEFKLKFKPQNTGIYSFRIDEIIEVSTINNSPTIQDIINVVRNGENLLIPPVTVTTTPTKILNANPLRRSFALRNVSNATVYISLDNIVNSNDYECLLEKNKVELFPIPYMGEIWGVVNNGTAIVSGVECVYSQII